MPYPYLVGAAIAPDAKAISADCTWLAPDPQGDGEISSSHVICAAAFVVPVAVIAASSAAALDHARRLLEHEGLEPMRLAALAARYESTAPTRADGTPCHEGEAQRLPQLLVLPRIDEGAFVDALMRLREECVEPES